MYSDTTKKGVLFALGAYTFWGIAPIYFKAISAVPPGEILAHRVIWSCLFIAVLLFSTKAWSQVRHIIKQPSKLKVLVVTSVLIAINWLVFIWAVNNSRMLDASLGYFINPLINIVLAMLFLGERFRPLQWLAVALAVVGVLFQLIQFGAVPWIALVLAVSFSIYGLLRKQLHLSALPGLFIETILLLPIALIYLFAFSNSESLQVSGNDWSLSVLLVSAGFVTTVPLLFFAGAATRLRLSTLGFFQYIGPSLMFILAVTVYGEAFSQEKMGTFACIWLALAIFSFDAYRFQKKSRQSIAAEA
ncbi:EamA family transporter RarD [Alginatibacterium sediminis]|uniref:EamA family transporter RarD n=1 Tax=Alginatibacterium sediminis TaxID=2164068 RepID=A0A420EN29_9ALTE|nr:EamA family transporter RarD [Alginatibacterium sediminis]RKF22090.1 EamA family transporter RarD [Alginatibacterium sediminis]